MRRRYVYINSELAGTKPSVQLFNRNIAVVLGVLSRQRPRSIWCMPRSKNWWQAVQAGTFGNNWWKENLRLSQSTFNIICIELCPFISRRDTVLRDCISVEEQVAITIWKLATNIEYRTLSELFGIGKSTVCKIVNDLSKNCYKFISKICKNSKRRKVKRSAGWF